MSRASSWRARSARAVSVAVRCAWRSSSSFERRASRRPFSASRLRFRQSISYGEALMMKSACSKDSIASA
jgi:hypothetical protein